MMERKFTDEEVIKALECCSQPYCNNNNCPLNEHTINTKDCITKLSTNSLDLINRQRIKIDQLKQKYDLAVAEREANVKALIEKTAEVERLTQNNISTKYPNRVLCSKGLILTKSLEDYDEWIADISAEAIKAFAERLASKVNCIPQHHFTLAQVLYDIDKLVKEMTVQSNDK